MFIYYFFTGCL